MLSKYSSSIRHYRNVELLSQCLGDPHDFVAYEEVLAPEASNLFDLFWDKMCSIIQSSLTIVIDNKVK